MEKTHTLGGCLVWLIAARRSGQLIIDWVRPGHLMLLSWGRLVGDGDRVSCSIALELIRDSRVAIG